MDQNSNSGRPFKRPRRRLWDGAQRQWTEENTEDDDPNNTQTPPPLEFPRLPDFKIDYTPLPLGSSRKVAATPAANTIPNGRPSRTQLLEAEDWIRRHGMNPLQVYVPPAPAKAPLPSSSNSKPNISVVMDDDDARIKALLLKLSENLKSKPKCTFPEPIQMRRLVPAPVPIEEPIAVQALIPKSPPADPTPSESDDVTVTDSEYTETDTASENLLKAAKERRESGDQSHVWYSDPTSDIPEEFAQVGQIPLLPRIRRQGVSYFAEISVATGPDNFFVTLAKQRSSKRALQRMINDTYTKAVGKNSEFARPNVSTLVPGLPVVCNCWLSSFWYRAEIISIVTAETSMTTFNAFSEPHTGSAVVGCKVLLLDEGSEHFILLNNIRYMMRNLLTFRAKATPCVLLKRNERKPWDQIAVTRFQELVTPKSQIRLKYINSTHTPKGRAWIVKFKMDIPDRRNPRISLQRTVDIGTEIRSTARQQSILRMYTPLVEDEFGLVEFEDDQLWWPDDRTKKRRTASYFPKVNPNFIALSDPITSDSTVLEDEAF